LTGRCCPLSRDTKGVGQWRHRFELKTFAGKGIILNLRANLYASIVVAGPMILGVVMLFGIKILSNMVGATTHEQDIIVVIVTYSILFPLLLTSLVSYVSTRYVADMLFEDHYDRVLPSMYGAISLCLLVGAIGWAIFLSISGVPFLYAFFSFSCLRGSGSLDPDDLFNAAKDYRSAEWVWLEFLGLLIIMCWSYCCT
jgi:hypothetical protein